MVTSLLKSLKCGTRSVTIAMSSGVLPDLLEPMCESGFLGLLGPLRFGSEDIKCYKFSFMLWSTTFTSPRFAYD